MSTRKNIDKLYNDKFRAAEVAPPEDAWQQIASRLPQEKQQKRILPLWFRYAGAAAFLALLLGLGGVFTNPASETSVVSSSKDRPDIQDHIRQASTEFDKTMLEVSMSLQHILQQENIGSVVTSEAISLPVQRSNNPKNIIAENGSTSSENPSGAKAEGSEAQSVNTGLLQNENTTVVVNPNNPDSSSSLSETGSENGINKERSEVVLSSEEQKAILEREVTAQNAIAQQVEAELSEPEEIAGQGSEGKLSISTRIAPVFYDNMAGGRNPEVPGGQSSGEVSLSYGINLAYQVSDKLKIRSGVNKLDLSYNTPGVPLAYAMDAISFNDKKEDPLLHTTSIEGDLQQQMDFIEVPMEVEYRLLDRAIDLNLIAGGSTLFLNRNELSLDAGARTTQLGAADDLKDVNFSANLGLGMDYQVAPGFHLNLEPMFKYQLNNFSAESGVRPYYMAIYSGFSISF